MESTGSCYKSDFDVLEATELRLGLPGTSVDTSTARGCKRAFEDSSEESATRSGCTQEEEEEEEEEIGQETTAPVAKAQVVGWPPVQSFRKNTLKATKADVVENGGGGGGLFVKVSMDGAPYLRKIDLKVYKGYNELLQALDNMFKCFCVGSENIVTYEDKDGDWMLVGDVPWMMFISSCKRLRIIKGSEARGSGTRL